MPTEAPKPQPRSEKHQGIVMGTIREGLSIDAHLPIAVPRKLLPLERNPFAHITVGNAIESVRSWLHEQPDSQEVYQQI
ncbi:MAG: hypothetical protein KGL95_13085, partial [Patescibacteria group bacterium]|nr:hypothetical protein [Patescibacteria group bacterium]